MSIRQTVERLRAINHKRCVIDSCPNYYMEWYGWSEGCVHGSEEWAEAAQAKSLLPWKGYGVTLVDDKGHRVA